MAQSRIFGAKVPEPTVPNASTNSTLADVTEPSQKKDTLNSGESDVNNIPEPTSPSDASYKTITYLHPNGEPAYIASSMLKREYSDGDGGGISLFSEEALDTSDYIRCNDSAHSTLADPKSVDSTLANHTLAAEPPQRDDKLNVNSFIEPQAPSAANVEAVRKAGAKSRIVDDIKDLVRSTFK